MTRTPAPQREGLSVTTARSVDQVRGFWRTAIVIVAIAVFVGAALVAVPTVSHILWLAVIVLVGGFLGIAWVAGLLMRAVIAAISRRFAADRLSARGPAVEAGWTFTAEGPAPSRELTEAVFMQNRQVLRADHTTEVITGEHGGYPFTAAHIDGYLTGFGDSGPKGRGPERAENVVILTLPGLLPEIKLRDRTASKHGDYGLNLPVMTSGNAAVDARFEVQSSHPDAARTVLGDDLLDFLATVSVAPCTVVFRDGQLVACRDPQATFDSIGERLGVLVGIADRVPPTAWNDVTPEVAGRGAYPLLIGRAGITVFKRERTVE